MSDELMCPECDEPVEPALAVDRCGESYHERCADKANERAYDNFLDDFYGGSSPQTDAERAEVEARKRF